MRQQLLKSLLRPYFGNSANVAKLGSSEAILCGCTNFLATNASRQVSPQVHPLSQISLNTFTTSSYSFSQPQTVPLSSASIDGDLNGFVSRLENILTSETLTASQLSDVAVTLTYLQVKGSRRIWGKVLEKISAVQESFDGASLSNLLWATSTAEVSHFKTIFELYGPATGLLEKLTPTQLSIVVEGLGKVSSPDYEFFRKVSRRVTEKTGDFKAAELARILGGFASTGVSDSSLIKAVAGALDKAKADLGPREVAQTLWALAKLKRADKSLVDKLLGAVKEKPEAAVDAAATVWALAFLNLKPEAETAKSLASVLKAGAAELKLEHAIQAAWGLSTLDLGDKATLSALFASISPVVAAAPEEVDVHALALLSEAVINAGHATGLDDKVVQYIHKVYSLVHDAAAEKQSQAVADFKADVAKATAWALGARFGPDVRKLVAAFPKVVDHVAVEIADTVGDVKVAVVPAGPHYLSATSPTTVLGPIVSHQKVLEAKGYKVVVVPFSEWAPLTDIKDKAKFILARIKDPPAAAKKASELDKKLEEAIQLYPSEAAK